jgi:hypothetical protein
MAETGGRRIGSTVPLAMAVVLGASVLAAGWVSSQAQAGSTTTQAEVASDKRIAPFSAKAGKTAYEPFPVIYAQFIAIDTDDNIAVEFHGPTLGTWFHIGEKRSPQQAISLPLAIPIDNWRVSCQNRVQKCTGIISIVGQSSAG